MGTESRFKSIRLCIVSVCEYKVSFIYVHQHLAELNSSASFRMPEHRDNRWAHTPNVH